MSARFFVAAEPLTKEHEKLFKDFIEEAGGTWWHWISNFWLIRYKDELAAPNSTEIYSHLISLNRDARIIISEVKDTDWLVTDTKNTNNRRMADWLERNWMDD